MQRYTIIFLLSILLLPATACKEDFLEIGLFAEVEETNFYDK